MQEIRDPMPPLGRMMVFVDGENLVLRFQDMVADGRAPQNPMYSCGILHRFISGCITLCELRTTHMPWEVPRLLLRDANRLKP